MTARDTARIWQPRRERCAQLGRLDRMDGLRCDVCTDGECWVFSTAERHPLLNADHWLLLLCMALLSLVLIVSYVVGQGARCDRLTQAANAPGASQSNIDAAVAHCPRDRA